MELLMVKVNCRYKAIEEIEDEELQWQGLKAYRGIVYVDGELLTMHTDEFVDKGEVEKVFKQFLGKQMQERERNILMDCIEYGLSPRERNSEYSKVQLVADNLPLDSEIRKWRFKLEIEVVDKDYSEYLDVVADYNNILSEPEFSVFELEKKVRATDLLDI